MANTRGKSASITHFIFLDSKITADSNCSHKIKRHWLHGKKAMTNLDTVWNSRDITLLTEAFIVKTVFFPGNHVWMWELGHRGGWALKNWYFHILMLEKTFENPLDYKEIKQVYPKGNQAWIFIGRTDAEAGIPVFWTPDVKNWLIGKDLDAGKDWR